jgi:hypothetical protein
VLKRIKRIDWKIDTHTYNQHTLAFATQKSFLNFFLYI